MSKTYVVFSCYHASPENGNERADWLGQFLWDIKPDVVVDLGMGQTITPGTCLWDVK